MFLGYSLICFRWRKFKLMHELRYAPLPRPEIDGMYDSLGVGVAISVVYAAYQRNDNTYMLLQGPKEREITVLYCRKSYYLLIICS